MSAARRSTLSSEGTRLALVYLNSYLADKPNRKKATAELLGCSLRTAARLTNRKQPYTSCMRLSWAYIICAAVNKSIGKLREKDVKSYGKSLVGWSDAVHESDALDAAADLATTVLKRALGEFNMSGGFSMHHEGGEILKVEVTLCPPGVLRPQDMSDHNHKLIFRSINNSLYRRPKMWMQYIHPKNGPTASVQLTVNSLERILKKINNEQRYATERIIRRTARRR